MGYVTYDYYKSIYGEDSMPETDFNRLSWEACRKVDTLTLNKLKFAFPTNEEDVEAVRRCVCKLIEIAGQIECEGQMEIAMPRLQEAIEAGADFDNVFCLNDLASVGVAAALDEYGMLERTGIYGVDGSPDAKALIKEGMMEATAAQFPSRIGAQAADVLYCLLRGEAVERMIAVPVELITRDNVDQYHVGRWQ